MTSDYVYVVFSFSEELGIAACNISVARSVEAVSSDAIFFVDFIGQGVHIGDLRDGCVKGSIEAGDLDDVGQTFLRGLYSGEVWRIMQGGEVGEFFDRSDDFVVDDNRAGKFFCSVYDSMADGGDFGYVLNYADFVINECLEYNLHTLFVVRCFYIGGMFCAVVDMGKL